MFEHKDVSDEFFECMLSHLSAAKRPTATKEPDPPVASTSHLSWTPDVDRLLPEAHPGKEKKDKRLAVPPPQQPAQLLKGGETAGAQWYDLPAATLTPELKRELQLLRLRTVIDPKHHYKSADSKSFPKFFQVGTVVEGPADRHSGRLTHRERKGSFGAELLHDEGVTAFRKRKYGQLQEQFQKGGKTFVKRRKEKRQPKWARHAN